MQYAKMLVVNPAVLLIANAYIYAFIPGCVRVNVNYTAGHAGFRRHEKSQPWRSLV